MLEEKLRKLFKIQTILKEKFEKIKKNEMNF